MPYRHSLRIRYDECDMQGIVFNAHYLAYCDDAFGAWVEAAMPGAMSFVGNAGSFDVIVKKAVVTWQRRPALRGDGRHRLRGGPVGAEQLRRRLPRGRWTVPSVSTC